MQKPVHTIYPQNGSYPRGDAEFAKRFKCENIVNHTARGNEVFFYSPDFLRVLRVSACKCFFSDAFKQCTKIMQIRRRYRFPGKAFFVSSSANCRLVGPLRPYGGSSFSTGTHYA